MPPVKTIPYGPQPDQAGDLHAPARWTGLVCLLHGGFWREPYGRDPMTPVAEDLARLGIAAWNIGYRRLGAPGVGWNEIASDVAAAVAYAATFRRHGDERPCLMVAGHSAGGQLALACTSAASRVARGLPVRPELVVSLAGVLDLEAAARENLGRGAVDALLEGPPLMRGERYRDASPLRLLPHGSRTLLIHGTRDDAVPIAQSRAYLRAASDAGDDVSLVEVEGAGHMDFLDTGSIAYCQFRERIVDRIARPAAEWSR